MKTIFCPKIVKTRMSTSQKKSSLGSIYELEFCFLATKWRIKILRIFLIVGHPRDPKGENHGYLTTFRGINAPKSGPFKYENNAQTLPKQLQNNFEKVQKTTFLTPKMVEKELLKLKNG